jgi:hypothetical protein
MSMDIYMNIYMYLYLNINMKHSLTLDSWCKPRINKQQRSSQAPRTIHVVHASRISKHSSLSKTLC